MFDALLFPNDLLEYIESLKNTDKQKSYKNESKNELLKLNFDKILNHKQPSVNTM